MTGEALAERLRVIDDLADAAGALGEAMADEDGCTAAIDRIFDSEAITDTPDEPHTITTLRTALEQGHQITLDYYHRNCDNTTHRTLSPTRIFSTDGQTYLHAYDHHINDHRIFRKYIIVTLPSLLGEDS